MIPATFAFPSESYPSGFSPVCSAKSRMRPSTTSDGLYGARPISDYSFLHQNNRGPRKPTNNSGIGSFRNVSQVNATQLSDGQHRRSFLARSSCFHMSNSPVSDLFEHMYKSSISSNSVTNDLSAKKFENDESRDSPSVTDKLFASPITPYRSCSSQADPIHDYTRHIDVTSKVAREMPKSPDYDNVSSCQSVLTENCPGYPGQFSDKSLKFQESVSVKDLIPPTVAPTSDGRSSGKGTVSGSYSSSISPLEMDSGIDFSESKEHLPCDKRLEQTSSVNESQSSYYGNTTFPQSRNLRDVQLTVFMKESTTNESFDIGASKFINKTFQRPPGDGRTGSMSCRVKNPGLVAVQNPVGPTQVMGLSGRSEALTPVTPFEYRKTSSETAKLSNDKVSMFQDEGNSSRLPVYYGGLQLIPMEKIRDNLDSGSLLRSTGDTNDKTNAHRLARRLYELDGFRKSDVAKHLRKRSDFAQLVRQAYLQQFDFSSLALDAALRCFLMHLVLSGETQERERILAEFSHRFVECNPQFFDSQDSCHILVCGIMLLNTDLHGKNGRKKMTVHEFVENLLGLNGGANFPKDLLKNIYNSIKNEPIEFLNDEVGGNSDISKDRQSTQSQTNPFLDIPDPTNAHEFKTGYLMRKCCLESDGRQTPMGKRGWKKFRASLRDLILYLHKDEHGFSCGTTFDDRSNAVHVHHSLAMDASDYAKRHDVFRLRTADWSEYLFQASDSRECQTWIDVINQVAAAFSAPPLSGAVGSQMKFQRPLMPSTCTGLSLKDQLMQHQQTLAHIETDLVRHREFCPEKGSRQRLIQDYVEKETYLEFEQRRFQTYCSAIEKLILSNADKSWTNDGYFQRANGSQASVHSQKKPTDGSGHSETDGEKRNLPPEMAHVTSASHCLGLHPAKSVPAFI